MTTSIKTKLNLDLLTFFVTLVDTGNLSSTAAKLSISTAKASRMVGECQLCFGEQLFVRHNGGLAPTQRARALADKVRSIIRELESLSERETFSPSTARAQICVAVVDNAFEMLFPPVLSEFAKQAPLSSINFHQYDTAAIANLRSGALDFAVFPIQHLTDDLQSERLVQTPYVRVVRADHSLVPLAGTEQLAEELPRFRNIKLLIDPDIEPIDPYVPGPSRAANPKNTAIVTRSWLGAAHMLLQTDFHTILPWLTVVNLARSMPLAVLEIMPNELVSTSLVWHKRNANSPLHVWFRCLCLSSIRRHAENLERSVVLGKL